MDVAFADERRAVGAARVTARERAKQLYPRAQRAFSALFKASRDGSLSADEGEPETPLACGGGGGSGEGAVDDSPDSPKLWFFKFKDLRGGTRVRVCSDVPRMVRECRRTTVRASDSLQRLLWPTPQAQWHALTGLSWPMPRRPVARSNWLVMANTAQASGTL